MITSEWQSIKAFIERRTCINRGSIYVACVNWKKKRFEFDRFTNGKRACHVLQLFYACGKVWSWVSESLSDARHRMGALVYENMQMWWGGGGKQLFIQIDFILLRRHCGWHFLRAYSTSFIQFNYIFLCALQFSHFR